MTREYTYHPGDHTPCPECGAPGGPDGMIRARGVMTDKEYNDRRCNKCGHLWTVGGTLDLPLDKPGKPTTPAKAESGEETPVKGLPSTNYDFGDGWEPDLGSDLPF